MDGILKPVLVKRGEFITGRSALKRDFYPPGKRKSRRLSAVSLWRRLETLADMQNLVLKSNNKFTLVSICNYATYNDKPNEVVQQLVQQPCSSLAAALQQPCTNNNDNNDNNNKRPSPPAAPEGVVSDEQPPVKPAKKTYSSAFETWYQAYPRKVGKKVAADAYARAGRRVVADQGIGREAAVSFLLERAAAFAQTPKGQAGAGCPHPATWLNGGRYDDNPAEWQVVEGERNTEPLQQPSLIPDHPPYSDELDAARKAREARQ